MWRTDLAMERCSAACDINALPEGIKRGVCDFENITIETIEISGRDASELVGKPEGRYVTVITPEFSSSLALSDGEIDRIAEELRSMLPENGAVLVVGLGNSDITPDAIGPQTVRQVIATRHIGRDAALQNGLGELRPAAAVAPGVLGQTGIESSEIVRALVEGIKPCAVIVIDALAARSMGRLGNTIQIANTGISPGSGVMNARKELSRASLGVPVVSVGVPTVVDAATLAADLLGCDDAELEAKRDLFEPGRRMMVTSRDIDQLIGHACKTLATAINRAIQKDMPLDVISYLMS